MNKDGTYKVLQVTVERDNKVVCRQCHEKIQYGRYDGNTLKRQNYWKAT